MVLILTEFQTEHFQNKYLQYLHRIGYYNLNYRRTVLITGLQNRITVLKLWSRLLKP